MPAALVLAALLLIHDPAEPFADWMASLMRPDFPESPCCGPSDQVYVDEYYPDEVGDGFIAHLGDYKLKIPGSKVIWNRVNPTGRGVLFYIMGEVPGDGTIYCFVPGAGA
jgi:hypothetical protein